MVDKPDPTRDASYQHVIGLVEEIIPVLAGVPREIVGGVLADLTAIWLAGNFDQRGVKETKTLREDMLTAHVDAVRRLIGPNESIILKAQRASEPMQ
jgi:hypothetical protein